jgi:uncharacterized membrane protein YhaH (DUF805 family)
MLRAPYFALSNLLFLFSAAVQLVWLNSIAAMHGGYLWLLMLMEFIAGLAVGFGYGAVAMARSRDAFGSSWQAVLAFIPIANFWLLLSSSKNPSSSNRRPTSWLVSGGVGVIFGFILLFAGAAILSYARIETERRVANAQSDPANQQVSLDMLIRAVGVEEAIREMALSVPTPRQIDDITVLIKAEADGAVLRYIYELSREFEALPVALPMNVIRNTCAGDALLPVIKAGGSIEFVYNSTRGEELGTIRVGREICGM